MTAAAGLLGWEESVSAARRRWSELSPRDWAVLHDLARVRLLTGRQVQRLHVVDGSPLTRSRRSRALLQRLNDVGLAMRLERRIGGASAGSSGFIYGLTAAGQRLTAMRGPAGGKRLRRPWEPGSSFTTHVLAVAELYVQLREAERAGTADLLTFDAEPSCWRWWTGLGGERLVLKPDAFVAVGTKTQERLSFVEVDRATESSIVLKRKALTYSAYWQTGQEQQRHGVYPGVLWLVPGERRQQQLVTVLSTLEPESWRLFQVRQLAEAVPALTPGPDKGTDDRADEYLGTE